MPFCAYAFSVLRLEVVGSKLASPTGFEPVLPQGKVTDRKSEAWIAPYSTVGDPGERLMDVYWTRRNRSDAPTRMNLVTSFSVIVGRYWLHNAPARCLGSWAES